LGPGRGIGWSLHWDRYPSFCSAYNIQGESYSLSFLRIITSLLLPLTLLYRAQMENLGIKPYTRKLKQWRAERVVQKYPKYDANVLSQYSRTSGLTGNSLSL